MKCKDCKHWNQRQYDDPLDGCANWECFNEAGIPEEKLGHCLAPGTMFAAVCEGESIYGQLITQADFGCILFEAKDGNKVNS